jgi:hypothetical protein
MARHIQFEVHSLTSYTYATDSEPLRPGQRGERILRLDSGESVFTKASLLCRAVYVEYYDDWPPYGYQILNK